MKKAKESKNNVIFKIIRIVLICLLITAILILGLYKLVTYQWQDEPKEYSANNQYITAFGETMVSAHRAGKSLFPQGTMMAFEGCVNSEEFETDIFEFDVHITADDQLIILHDNILDEVSDAVEYFGKSENYPENYTYEEIRQLNLGEFFKDKDGETPYNGLRGDNIPDTLRAVRVSDALSYLEKSGGYYYSIEIKNSGELGLKAADILYDILTDMKLLDRVIVASFNRDVISHLEENYPDLTRTAVNVEVVKLYIDSLFDIERPEGYYKFNVLQVPPDRYIVNLGTPKLINYAHKNNIAVQYWTINDPERMLFLKSIGTDCIITDVPDLAYEVLTEQIERFI